jgi:hypothetical protein
MVQDQLEYLYCVIAMSFSLDTLNLDVFHI